MSDNEIELRYGITEERKGDADHFRQAVPHEQSIGDFILTIEEGDLRALTYNYHDEESARTDLEPKLEDWEKAAQLNGFRIRFRISSVTLIDKSEENIKKSVNIFVPTAKAVVLAHPPIIQEIPIPASALKDSELARIMLQKVHDLEDGGKRSWSAIAYSIVTEILNSCGKDYRERYRISCSVFKELRRLVSQYDPDFGRKAKGTIKRFTPEELDWIRQTAIMIGYRVVAVEYGNDPDEVPLITMGNLPKP